MRNLFGVGSRQKIERIGACPLFLYSCSNWGKSDPRPCTKILAARTAGINESRLRSIVENVVVDGVSPK